MIFTWEDGQQREFHIGNAIKGLTIHDQRPVSVTFSAEDLSYITSRNAYVAHELLRRIERVLK